MAKEVLQVFYTQMNKVEGKQYLLLRVAYEAAPILKKVKPAALMCFSQKGKNTYELWRQYKNEICAELGLSYIELKKNAAQVYVLFYDYKILNKLIRVEKNKEFLAQMGYGTDWTFGRTMKFLKKRFAAGFPHEIGLFLGIPLTDVDGFIKHNGTKYLFCRYWKVYDNPVRSRILFERYDKAKLDMILSLSAAS